MTNDKKKVYFGTAGYSDFTIHKDEETKLRYIKRHNNENWTKSGINSAGFWSRWLLWQEGAKDVHFQQTRSLGGEGVGKVQRERGERAEGTCEEGLGAEGLDDWLDLI
jgi:hypothetical protein